MKLVVQTQLVPDIGQDRALKAIVERFNEARNWVAVACFARRETNQFEVRKFAYREVRERFGLSSQMAQLAIKKGYGNDSVRNGPSSSQSLHIVCEAVFAFS